MIDYKLQMYSATSETECVNRSTTTEAGCVNRSTITELVRNNARLLEECLAILNAITEHLLGESRPPRPKNEIKGLMQDVCENTELTLILEHGLEELRAILGA